MKKHIPNLLTLLNLTSGILAIYMVLIQHPEQALILFLCSLLFDFLDGISARLLHADSEFGKELDSLADIVSFGLFSTAMIYSIMHMVLMPGKEIAIGDLSLINKILLYSVLLIPTFSALRLARFNLQKDTSFFMGLPVPAFALFWSGIYFEINFNNSFYGKTINAWFLFSLILITCILMVVPLPVLSLKFKNFKLNENFGRYLLILLSIIILAFTGISGLPLVILTYILLSLLRILIT